MGQVVCEKFRLTKKTVSAAQNISGEDGQVNVATYDDYYDSYYSESAGNGAPSGGAAKGADAKAALLSEYYLESFCVKVVSDNVMKIQY